MEGVALLGVICDFLVALSVLWHIFHYLLPPTFYFFSTTEQADGVQGGAMFKDLTKNLEISWPSEDTGLQGNATVRVTFPPKDEHEEQVNPPPKLAEVVSENQNTAESESKVPRQCTLCGIEVPADRAPRCSRCKAVIYCSHACQKKHWKETHKVSCELYKVPCLIHKDLNGTGSEK